MACLTAQQLIARSWYLSGIEARELQSIGGDRLTVGLELLNDLLNFAQAQTDLLPYFKLDETVSTVAGQEKYFVQNLAQLDGLSYDLNNVRYKMRYIPHNEYMSTTRVNNLTTLPNVFTTLRAVDGLDVFIYPIPDTVYELNIFGKFYLAEATLSTDLCTVFDKAYVEYLRFALADYMCMEYGVELPPRTMLRYKQVKKILKSFSPPDVSVQVAGLDIGGQPIGLTFLQFYNGYVP